MTIRGCVNAVLKMAIEKIIISCISVGQFGIAAVADGEKCARIVRVLFS